MFTGCPAIFRESDATVCGGGSRTVFFNHECTRIDTNEEGFLNQISDSDHFVQDTVQQETLADAAITRNPKDESIWRWWITGRGQKGEVRDRSKEGRFLFPDCRGPVILEGKMDQQEGTEGTENE